MQLYTGLIYGGPALPGEILRGIANALDRESAPSIAALRDTRTDHWAKQPLV